MTGELEGHLLEAQEAVARMVERPLAAFAAEHAVLLPHLREVAALPGEPADQPVQRRVVEMGAAMRAELGGDPPRPPLPVADQRACRGRQKDEPQQIALA